MERNIEKIDLFNKEFFLFLPIFFIQYEIP